MGRVSASTSWAWLVCNSVQVRVPCGSAGSCDCEAADELYDRFANPKIKVGMEWVTKSCNLNAVTISISSIAKNIFGRLFRYLVDMCNNTLIDPTMKKVPDTKFFPRLVHYGLVIFDIFLIHHHRLINTIISPFKEIYSL